MPNINFPTSPALNDQYSFGGKTWTWNGVAWVILSSPTSLRLDSSYGQANSAFDKANTALSNTNLNVSGTLRALSQGGDEGGELFLDKPANNTSLAAGITIDIYQNKLRFFETGGSVRGVFIDIANSAAGGVGTDLLNPASTPDTVARATADAAFAKANTADQRAVTSGAYANSSYLHANAAFTSTNVSDQRAVTSGVYANAAFAVANTADQRAVTSGAYANSSYIHANAAFAFANTVDQKAVSAGSYANAAFAAANTADQKAVSAGSYANSAYNTANTADQRAVTSGAYANSAFVAANTADQKSVTSGSYANSAYLHANAAFAAANSGGSGTDVYARNHANSSYIHANAAFAAANSGGGGGGSDLSIQVDVFTGTGACTTFTLTSTPTDKNLTTVIVGGVQQLKSSYNIAVNEIVFSEAPGVNSNIEVSTYSGGGTVIGSDLSNRVDVFTGTGACTTFTLTSTPTDKNLTTVIVGGVQQLKSSYNIAANQIIFSEAPTNNSDIEVCIYSGGGTLATSFKTVVDTFNGNNTATTFTLSTIPQHERETFAFLNGVYQQKDTYSISGANITFTGTATSNDTIEVVTISGSEMNVTSSRYNSRVYTGTGACTSFNISSSHTANSVLVFENGVCQEPITDYTVTGTVLTFTTAPDNGVKIQIRELPV